jgi:hypothetical protein
MPKRHIRTTDLNIHCELGMEGAELTDTGHALHHTHPEQVARLISSFSLRLAATHSQEAPHQTQGAPIGWDYACSQSESASFVAVPTGPSQDSS